MSLPSLSLYFISQPRLVGSCLLFSPPSSPSSTSFLFFVVDAVVVLLLLCALQSAVWCSLLQEQ
jgi:hypothetical protein